MPDGSPQVTPVWVDVFEDRLRVNTAEGRVKTRNMRRDPHVSLSASDPDDPYHYVVKRAKRPKWAEKVALSATKSAHESKRHERAERAEKVALSATKSAHNGLGRRTSRSAGPAEERCYARLSRPT